MDRQQWLRLLNTFCCYFIYIQYLTFNLIRTDVAIFGYNLALILGL